MDADLITVGRVTMDLHAQDIGAPFEEVTGFDAMVGGSPTNIAIGTARLGLRSIAFTGVGDDLVGEYVLRYLRDAGVETRYVVRKAGKHTSLALVAVQPPDRFPLTFYRDDPADIHLSVEDAAALPFDETAALLLSGNAFSRGSCAAAARYCGERGRAAGSVTYMDLDLRPTEWTDARDYGRTLRAVFGLADVIIGTEVELFAVLAPDPDAVVASQSLAHGDGDALDRLLDGLTDAERPRAVVIKRGPRGATVLAAGERLDVPGYAVETVNTVGAGDAFAAGLIRSRSAGWDWHRSTRYANACGAIVVTRHGCSAAFPTEAEVAAFIEANGGL